VPPQEKVSQVFRRYFVAALGVVSVLVITAALYRLRDVALIVAFGGFLAYFLAGPVDMLTRRRVPRRVAVRVVCYTSLLLVLGILGPLGTVLYNQAQSFVSTIPGLLADLESELQGWSLTIVPGEELKLAQYLDQVVAQVQHSAPAITSRLLNYTQSVVFGTAAVVVALLLIPLITLYMLLDSERLKRALLGCFPGRMHADVERAMSAVNCALSGYIYSKTAMSLFVGVSTCFVLLILRVPFAVILGILACVGEFIPVVGPWIAFVPIALVALSCGPVALLWVVVAVVVIQLVQNYIIAPKLMGDTMNLHPLTVLLSLVVGGALGGVLGLIIATPAAAAAKVILNIFVFKRGEPGIAVPSLDLISAVDGEVDMQERPPET
jgi:predicted PurR-regulated permease PerM